MMKSFYFQHDYNSANDHKILFLRQQFGIEGYGIYWYIIEQLAQNSGKLPLKIIPVIAMQIQTTADKVNAVIRNYDLFIIEDEIFFSLRLMKQIEFRTDLSISGKKGAEIRWAKKSLIDTRNSPAISHAISDPNAKKRKGKEIKEIFNEPSEAFDHLKNDPIYIEELQRIFLAWNIKVTEQTIAKAIQKFLLIEFKPGVEPSDLRFHCKRWINRNTKDFI